MLRTLSNMKREVGQIKHLFATCGQLDGILAYMKNWTDAKAFPTEKHCNRTQGSLPRGSDPETLTLLPALLPIAFFQFFNLLIPLSGA